MNLKTDNHIILDRIETWPTKFLTIFKENTELIKNYLAEEDQLENNYKSKFEELIRQLEQTLSSYKIIGIHCTRLLDEEVVNLKEGGLRPLSQELAKNKISIAYSKGLISTDFRNELLQKQEYEVWNRTGMAYFFLCLSTLNEEDGLSKFFGYWGGEAIYMDNKDSSSLKKIGNPCIVLLSISISELKIYEPLSELMIKGFFENDFDSQDRESIMKKPVKVINVIQYPEEPFEELTNYSRWEEPNMNF